MTASPSSSRVPVPSIAEPVRRPSAASTEPARAVVPALASQRGWIVSPRYDLVFFLGSVLAPLALWGAFHIGWITGVVVFAIFQLAFNMPHNFQTWTMSVLDKADRAKNGQRYIAALAAIVLALGVPMALSPDRVFPLVRDALVYWGYYHLVRQHFGFQRLYERRMSALGSPAHALESKLYARFLEVVSYAPLLLRFRDPELMTIHAGDQAIWIRHPVLPALAWQIVLSIWLVTIAAAVVHHVVAAARGRRHLLPRALLFASVALCFGMVGLVIRDVVVAIAVVTSFHNLQYLGLVFFHNRTRAEIGERENLPRGTNAPIDWLRSKKLALYLGVTFGYGVVLIAPMALFPDVLLAQLPLSVMVALHYYVDARVWKFDRYPMLARYLRLKP